MPLDDEVLISALASSLDRVFLKQAVTDGELDLKEHFLEDGELRIGDWDSLAPTTMIVPRGFVRGYMKAEGKSNREICAAEGIRHTEDVPHPVEHIRFGRRLRSHKVNRLVG